VLTEELPARGLSGHEVRFVVRVEHGRGETVLPRGLQLQAEAATAKELQSAGFGVPDPEGAAPPRLQPAEDGGAGERTTTVFELPLVPLPREPGRHELRLPPLPLAVARASGEIMTVCTRPHTVVVEDPIASTPEAEPRPNPPPMPQREEWTALKQALLWGSLGLLAGGLLAYAAYRYAKRPRPAPPPPPPRPPWEVALERLDEIRHAGLLEQGRFAEFFDRVNDTVRLYLGARFGFDGLECTTAETLRELTRAAPQGITLTEVQAFLADCDLVKFANVTPAPEDCARILAAGESLVRSTSPRVRAFAEGATAP
jgi:hypothetical protein